MRKRHVSAFSRRLARTALGFAPKGTGLRVSAESLGEPDQPLANVLVTQTHESQNPAHLGLTNDSQTAVS
jgi:hypothetical protein